MADAVPGVSVATAAPMPDLRVPRLVRALNEVLPPPSSVTGATDVERHLNIIEQRLLAGLDPLWQGGESNNLWDGKIWDASNPDEQWARQVTEFLFGLPYFGPHQIVARALNAEQDVYRRFLGTSVTFDAAKNKTVTPVDPMLPLGAACQHSVSVGIMTRGFDEAGITKQGRGFPNVGCEPLTNFPAYTWRNAVDFTTALTKGFITPGSACTWAEFNHAAFVLRVDKQNRFAQFFDTGAVGGPCLNPDGSGKFYTRHQDADAVNALGDAGLYDDPARRSVRLHVGGSGPGYLGVGTANSGALPAELARMKTIRPMGLARLILRSRIPASKLQGRRWTLPDGSSTPIDPQVLFVSKVLPMYGSGPNDNFFIARLAWSLRNLSDTATVESRWVVFSPQTALATVMLAAPRADRIEQLETALKRPINATDLKIVTAVADQASGPIAAKFKGLGPVQVIYRIGVGTTIPVKETFNPKDPTDDRQIVTRNPRFSYVRGDVSLPPDASLPAYLSGR